jgi:two-component system, cell cycle response regulator DivK
LILVVDPDPDTRAMYVAGLALAGWNADGVTDGREALAKAISYRPAAIVTETRVPRLNVLELCRLLRSDPDTHHIPILVVTGDAEQRRIAAAEEAGADRVLIKPCLPDELVRAIKATLSAARDRQVPRVVTAHGSTSRSISSGRALSKRHQRFQSTMPPSRPPELHCPRCDQPLTYQKSHIGGVSAKHSEQWDHYECSSGCGQFLYRQRTRKLRDVS